MFYTKKNENKGRRMSNLPFLRQKNMIAANGDEEPIKRKPDGEESYDMLDAVADDMADAFEKKDKKLLRAALESLCHYIRLEDEEQDSDEGV